MEGPADLRRLCDVYIYLLSRQASCINVHYDFLSMFLLLLLLLLLMMVVVKEVVDVAVILQNNCSAVYLSFSRLSGKSD